jgi:hypothetical protein
MTVSVLMKVAKNEAESVMKLASLASELAIPLANSLE